LRHPPYRGAPALGSPVSFDLLLPRPASLPDALGVALDLGAFVVPDPELVAIRGVRLAWPERSIRGVAAIPLARGVHLRLPPLASTADVELAVALAATVAERLDIAVDDMGTLRRAGSLRNAWPASRCRAVAESAAGRLLADVDTGGLRVPGLHRDLWIGPGLKAELRGSAAGLLACARLAQWPGTPEPAVPSPTILGCARIAEPPSDRPVLLRSVDLLSLPGPTPCIVPVQRLIAALGEQARRLDEHSWLIDPIPPERWPALRRQLGAHHIPVPEAWRPVIAEDQLLPVLRPADWPGRDTALCWGLTERDDELLWVSLVRDEGASLRPLPPRGVEAQRRIAALDRAVRNLESRLPSFEVERSPDGRVRGLTLLDPQAAEALLSVRVLHVAHELLGTRALVASVPFRGLLRLQDAYPADQAEVTALARWTERGFAEAADRPGVQRLSPRLFVIVDGRVQGPLRAAGDERTSEEGSLDLAAVVSASSDSPALVARPIAVPALSPPALHPAVASLLVPGLGQVFRGQALEAGAWFGLEIALVVALAVGVLPLAFGPLALLLVHGASAAHAWLVDR